MSGGPLAQWQFQVPNAILIAAVYLMIVRCLLSLVVAADGDNFVWRLVRSVTDPVVRPIGFVTPRIIPTGLLPVLAIAWLLGARILLKLAVVLWTVRPRLGGL